MLTPTLFATVVSAFPIFGAIVFAAGVLLCLLVPVAILIGDAFQSAQDEYRGFSDTDPRPADIVRFGEGAGFAGFHTNGVRHD